MKKIPTIFERDWEGDRSLVVDKPNPECAWVFRNEGIATVKLDGTCVKVEAGKRYKRREITERDAAEGYPPGFELVDHDILTGKIVGWVPVGDGPEDKWHRAATGGDVDGTYELIGPKVQGNPEHWATHELIPHGLIEVDPPRTFSGLKEWFTGKDLEGVVFHHPDGRMAKIKMRDFGLKRAKP